MLLFHSYTSLLSFWKQFCLCWNLLHRKTNYFKPINSTNRSSKASRLCQVPFRYLYLPIQNPDTISPYLGQRKVLHEKQTIRKVHFLEELGLRSAASISLWKLSPVCNSWHWKTITSSAFPIKLVSISIKSNFALLPKTKMKMY